MNLIMAYTIAMLIVKRKPEVPPKVYCENEKSTNQTAVRGLMPHEIYSRYALDAVYYKTKFLIVFNIIAHGY